MESKEEKVGSKGKILGNIVIIGNGGGVATKEVDDKVVNGRNVVVHDEGEPDGSTISFN
ncbi:hypothetical protein HPP92_027451 [Vanilla planifolia]|uniref:Uncharacterized protein n=1 Tax=Vanilla planifolia TaxID=51239 RepID=A0A835RPR3_VANPL|nr:hypothetical protein HPP92_027451 [Vanilla planifolia]KAG0493094.1 hypothetical protein HPP92_006492 [Vanilla planifolia]